MGVLGRVLFTVVAFLATLIFEILLAMSLFVYIRLYLPPLFDSLQNFSFWLLNAIRDTIRDSAPDLAENVNVALVGDLSANAVTLLVLGLFASGVIRVIIWSVRSMFRRGDR